MAEVFELKDAQLVKRADGEMPPGWEQDSDPVEVDETDRLGGYYRLATIQLAWLAKGYKVLWRVEDGKATMWTQHP